MNSYKSYIESKRLTVVPQGLNVSPDRFNPVLFPHQLVSVLRALKLGKSALYANTGLGKGFMILQWAKIVAEETNCPVIVVAPLSVSHQFKRESAKFGVDVTIAANQSEIQPGINITNYEKLSKFDPRSFSGAVLDEASLLKGNGSMSKMLIEFASVIPYRLSATATPSPNDFEEFGLQSEFLGIMTKAEMLSTFFTHDGGDTSVWRLKKWGESKFWEWLASWATVYRMPSDIGFNDDGFVLPPLVDHHHVIDSYLEPEEGALFASVASMNDRRRARRESIGDRVKLCAELANNSNEPWLIWCELNSEADELVAAIEDAKQVSGSMKPEKKEQVLNAFSSGNLRILVSKPSICGSGLNWQHCRNVVFVGINDSWESLYQATNRVYRFGQTQEVHRHLIFSKHEYPVFENLKRKAEQADRMWESAARYFRDVVNPTQRYFVDYQPTVKMEIPSWLQ
jgi:Helicase conserved C-terminal domain